ncbi:PRCC domain-containing protein [Aspergillus brunneoviolaceus CBS 621.78]|uniref:Uncharacterized protein n=1 Tax=Aspergillus brunneoviolaceus CBS 621.78 TaxID=1450534 RepID=A0ACD1FY94_9EURO|nr:hypothetical protein BO95DRAFT_505545 [Aspergillus brunneoviolaceus CBS 621.78]RAH41913.1 hypothetical protein BO95DRAFT_505545 [Aspergillus brunneoviolaceus CBS 621.78]
MALVAYSDSEASDSEPETTTTTTTTKKPTSTATAPAPPSTTTTSSTTPNPFQIDRGNPRKIRVALPDLKPDPSTSTSTNEDTDGPARKKPRIGGGGAFAGFNALLPAPKKPATTPKPSATGSTRKVFSLKTGATPGFDRQADAEMRSEMAFGRLGGEDGVETIPKAGSLRGGEDDILGEGEGGGKNEGAKPPQEVKLKGNPMMFKPLSVGRGTQGKGKRKAAGPIAVTGSGGASAAGPLKKDLGVGSSAGAGAAPPVAAAAPAPAPAPPKPKISLFSLSSSTEETVTAPAAPAAPAAYEPLVYTSTQEAAAPAGPEPASAAAPELTHPSYTPPSTASGNTTLGAIADDLNLTRAQRRQLFGRSADPSGSAATAAAPRVLHFNTDQEYAANQHMAHEDLAAAQHNPVRAIAPGKHTLQQLVSAASTQREALEESFATGRRNKKEAGSKYGW